MRLILEFVFFLVLLLFASCQNYNLTNAEKENLINKLDSLVVQDQIAAGVPSDEDRKMKGDEKAWADFTIIKEKIFQSNYEEVKTIYEKYGFLGIDKVGEKGSNNFWLMIQHFDFDVEFQEEILKKMKKEVQRKNANPANYAYLRDRVNINKSLKQEFGTQVDYSFENQRVKAFPKNGLIDSVNVDLKRKQYNLEPLKDYLNSMMKFHYEMNKEFNPELIEPNYYK